MSKAMPVAEMDREALEEEVEFWRDLIDIRGADDPSNPDLGDLWVAGAPIGKIIISLQDRVKGNEKAIDQLEHGEPGASLPVDSVGLPAHRMFLAAKAGGEEMGEQHFRVAVLFGEFVARVVSNEESLTGEKSRVDRSGQKYTLSSGEARQALVDAGAFEDVAKKSRSTITARIMRDVQRMTKLDDCDCEEIDDCGHGVVEFRPGRPHVLAVGKQRFTTAMRNAYDDPADASAADDPSEQDGEATEDVDDTLDQLEQATTEGRP